MSTHDHHPPCPNGCGELADECACPNPNPLGSMTIEPPIGSGGKPWACDCDHPSHQEGK